MSGADLVAAVQAALPAWQATHAAQREAIAPRRRQWAAVMAAALPGFDNCEDLFVRHALLVAVARVVARGVDASELQGGLDWPLEVPGLMDGLVDRLAGIDWVTGEDVLGPLYAGLITAGQRKGAGEFYTPDWLALRVLARVMHAGDRVMDPACGSGTFLFHAVRRALAEPGATIEGVVRRVRGVDLHPVAVVLARANYLLALGRPAGVIVPIRQGDGMVGRDGDVDVLIGNPPWLAFRFMTAAMQATFRAQSEVYNLWGGGAVSTHQDLCGLFAVRVIDRLLKMGGRFGFVMPGAVLDRAQFVGFRGGRYGDGVCVDFFDGWDLRRVRPHVFPVAAAVVFGARAQRAGAALTATQVWARDASLGPGGFC
jgi:SAM-dependent methyltransferase